MSGTPSYTGWSTGPPMDANPLVGQAAYVQSNAGYPAFETVTVNLGTLYAGKTVQIRFVVATDNFVGGPGWEIDNFVFPNITNTPFPALVPSGAICVSISIVSGAQQWTPPGAPFAQPLLAKVRKGLAPMV